MTKRKEKKGKKQQGEDASRKLLRTFPFIKLPLSRHIHLVPAALAISNNTLQIFDKSFLRGFANV